MPEQTKYRIVTRTFRRCPRRYLQFLDQGIIKKYIFFGPEELIETWRYVPSDYLINRGLCAEPDHCPADGSNIDRVFVYQDSSFLHCGTGFDAPELRAFPNQYPHIDRYFEEVREKRRSHDAAWARLADTPATYL